MANLHLWKFHLEGSYVQNLCCYFLLQCAYLPNLIVSSYNKPLIKSVEGCIGKDKASDSQRCPFETTWALFNCKRVLVRMAPSRDMVSSHQSALPIFWKPSTTFISLLRDPTWAKWLVRKSKKKLWHLQPWAGWSLVSPLLSSAGGGPGAPHF